MNRPSFFFLLAPLLAACHPSEAQSNARELVAALTAGDAQSVRAIVQTERLRLGTQAGEPEVADTYQKVPANTPLLDPSIAQRGFSPHFDRLKQIASPWKPGLDPTQMTEPLRAPASVVSGCAAIAKANLQGKDDCLTLANQTADFLLWAQEQAGAGCFPFPAAKGTSEARAMQVATRFLDRAEKAGKLDQTVRNNWAFEDHGDGGLQFDNAECALALFDLHSVTQNPRHLVAALKAADWALARPLCPNWNYNAFSVHLLAKAHSVTQEPRYLEAAVQKALLGVIPGQLTDGPYAGRWMDPHNARPAYHYIMMSALAKLTATLPTTHPDHPTILTSLRLGLTTRNAEFTTLGVMTKDKAIETLLLVTHLFQNDPAFLESTHTTTALHTLSQLISEEARRGKLPLSPSGWGQFLAHSSSEPKPKPKPLTIDPELQITTTTGQDIHPFRAADKATLLLFITTDCPIANRYAPEIERIRTDFAPKGIQITLIHTDPGLTNAAAVKHAQEYSLKAPVVIDRTHRLVSATAATTTPEAIVIDPTGHIRYRGRIDDQFADFGDRRQAPTTQDLRLALTALLENRPIPNPETKPLGCLIPNLP